MAESQHPLQRPRVFIPGLKNMAWWNRADVPLVGVLEQNYCEIRAEFTNLLICGRMRLHPEQHQVANGDWNIFPLFSLRQRNERNAIEAPVTTGILEASPEVSTLPDGVSYFSVVDPHSHVLPHCGPTNRRIRIHLGLSIPDGAEMRVGTEFRAWDEGKCVVFDDSFEHEVYNRSEFLRAVLLIDIWHPDISPEQREKRVQLQNTPSKGALQRRDGWRRESAVASSQAGSTAITAALLEATRILRVLEKEHLLSIQATAEKLLRSRDLFISKAAAFVVTAISSDRPPPPIRLLAIGDAAASSAKPWTSISGLIDGDSDLSLTGQDLINAVHICALYWRVTSNNRRLMAECIEEWATPKKKAFIHELVGLGNLANIIRSLAKHEQESVEIPFGASAPIAVVAAQEIARR